MPDGGASMRPRLFSGERATLGKHGRARIGASMRPRLFSGERHQPRSVWPIPQACFNEAPLIQRGKVDKRVSKICKQCGFNEAPLIQRGKVLPRPAPHDESVGFNEAPLIQRGKARFRR